MQNAECRMQNFGAQKCAVEEKADGGSTSLRREGVHLLNCWCYKKVPSEAVVKNKYIVGRVVESS